MFSETTTKDKYTAIQPHLYMAFELSQSKWLLGFTIDFGQRPRLRTIAARDLTALQQEIQLAKHRFGLADDVQVVSCYEAGRDGFSRRTPGRCGCTAFCSLSGLPTW